MKPPAPSAPKDKIASFFLPWNNGIDGSGALQATYTVGSSKTSATPPNGISIWFDTKAMTTSGIAAYFSPAAIFNATAPLTELTNAATAFQNSGGVFDNAALRYIQGYLNYTTSTLNLLYATTPGRQILDAITTSGQVVKIALRSINCFRGGVGKCWIASELTRENLAMCDTAGILSLIETASRNIGNPAAACVWAAQQINNFPLYSLFAADPAPGSPGFLGQYFTGAQAITGQKIQDWLTGTDTGAFVTFLNTDTFDPAVYVFANRYFKPVLISILYAVSAPGTLEGGTIEMGVTYDPTNPNDAARHRPPAIGLAHELVHAYHNVRGMQPGIDQDSYTTLLFERLCVGIPPFDNTATFPNTENTLRAAWPAVMAGATIAFDKPAALPARTIYDPIAPTGLAQMRKDTKMP